LLNLQVTILGLDSGIHAGMTAILFWFPRSSVGTGFAPLLRVCGAGAPTTANRIIQECQEK